MAIKLTNFTAPELAFARLAVTRRDDVVRLLVERLVESGKTSDGERLRKEVLSREEVETTGIGQGIAIPHARVASVTSSVVATATLAEPVAWNSVDGEPVDVVFLLVGNREMPGQQLQVLARISKLVRIESFLTDLRAAETPAALFKAIGAAEARHF